MDLRAEMRATIEICRQTRETSHRSREEMRKTQLQVREASRKGLDRSWHLIVRSKRLFGVDSATD
jgi:hypothetical protein